MISRLRITLLLVCLAAVIVGLSACVAPEESEEAVTLTPTLLAEDESPPQALPTAESTPSLPREVPSSPLAVPSSPLAVPSSPLVAPLPPTESPGGPKKMVENQEEAVAAAVEALADRLEVTADQIEVVSAKSVQFSDTSLGCPQPGMMYAQVITPGYQVLLRLEGQTYDYRVAGRQVVLCQGKQ